MPFGFNKRICRRRSDTLEVSKEVRAPFNFADGFWLRVLLDPIVSPQLATVATMLLVAVFVLTNTVSADGSISGVYSASLRLAERSADSTGGINEITKGIKDLVGGQRKGAAPAGQQSQPQQQPKPNKAGENKQ